MSIFGRKLDRPEATVAFFAQFALITTIPYGWTLLAQGLVLNEEEIAWLRKTWTEATGHSQGD